MNSAQRIAYLASRDAYFARMLSIVDAMIADEVNYPNGKPVPKDSGDPVDGLPCGRTDEPAVLSGTLNANLHPCMLPFEDFVSDLCHKSHPFCD